MKTCCICNIEFDEWGNNPDPFPGEICCSDCDNRYVIPIRIMIFRKMLPLESIEATLEFLKVIASIGRGLAVTTEKAKEAKPFEKN